MRPPPMWITRPSSHSTTRITTTVHRMFASHTVPLLGDVDGRSVDRASGEHKARSTRKGRQSGHAPHRTREPVAADLPLGQRYLSLT